MEIIKKTILRVGGQETVVEDGIVRVKNFDMRIPSPHSVATRFVPFWDCNGIILTNDEYLQLRERSDITVLHLDWYRGNNWCD